MIDTPSPKPTALSLRRAKYSRFDGPQTAAIYGAGFTPDSIVTIDGVSVPKTFVSAVELHFAIANTLLWEVGSHRVAVHNRGPGGGVSEALMFDVEQLRGVTYEWPTGTTETVGT